MSARMMLLATGAVLLGATTMVPATANAACRSFVQASAEGTFKTPTELISRSRWRGEVRDRYGSEYAFWSRAKEKTTRCTKSDPGNKWHCTARARPCNS